MNNVINSLINEIFFKNPLFWIMSIFIIVILIFWKKIIGKAGEFWVKQELRKLDKNKYLTINDVNISTDRKTHQIDHIVVSKFGIFVIETKQYNGYIKGNEFDKKWIQNKKFTINNPILQNYGHVKSLEKALELPNNVFIPIICIPSTAKLNIKSSTIISRAYNLNEIIMSFKEVILDNYIDVYNKVLSINITDRSIKHEHNKYVKSIIKENAEFSKTNKCPLCGGKLIQRNSKYGKFFGCSNYPKCKYTKSDK